MDLDHFQTELDLILTATLFGTKGITHDVLQKGLYGWMWLDPTDVACYISSHRVW